jgi:hypothetical protein
MAALNAKVVMELEYKLDDAGWVNAALIVGDFRRSMTVSYLHDSLKQLLEGIIALYEGADKAVVVFMDEPGEHQLLLSKADDSFTCELRWYRDWASWDMHPKDQFEQVVTAPFELQLFSKNIIDEVDKIYCKYGVEGYKENWVEHDFPYNQYMKLKRLVGT